MSKTAVRLTTENYDFRSQNCTNIYPYDYCRNSKKLNVAGKSKILIHDFHMIDASRVEIFWGNQANTTNIFYGNQSFDIPSYCNEIIFVLDPFHHLNQELSLERVAEFDFELI